MQGSNAPATRLPAEWENTDAVLLAWPHKDTDWAYMLDEVENCYIHLAHAIARHARLIIIGPRTISAREQLTDIAKGQIFFLECPTNDTWIRDYGPICSIDGTKSIANDFVFNGWGLKFASCLDNCATRHLRDKNLIKTSAYANRLDMVLEGGSIDSDGEGTLLTTSECLLSPNRNAALSRKDIEQRLSQIFGLQKVLWLDHGHLAGDDTDSHVDTLARLAPHCTIIYTGCDNPADEHYADLKDMATQLAGFKTPEGNPYNLIELPLPDPIYDEDGQRLPATYANYLPLNDAVLIPVYGQNEKDILACQILQSVFPDHKIETIDCRPLIKQHGSLHCATMQLPHGILSF